MMWQVASGNLARIFGPPSTAMIEALLARLELEESRPGSLNGGGDGDDDDDGKVDDDICKSGNIWLHIYVALENLIPFLILSFLGKNITGSWCGAGGGGGRWQGRLLEPLPPVILLKC